eukprot:TRINITY_DN12502_c0_g1_i1.p1 TRINITY_DN12502_c0_g1~~TRINITY_DN12502_c0_g1_i1.p1  ORF type:complete len:152 (+),score=21.50 TRINITY_DN12502_c0_g1_i1:57-458(+)
MAISPYMNRKDSDQTKMTLGFIDFVCLPLWTGLRKYWDGTNEFLENLHRNREKWASGEALTFVPKPAAHWSAVRKMIKPKEKIAPAKTANILDLSFQLLKGLHSDNARPSTVANPQMRRKTMMDPLLRTRLSS